MIWICRRFKSAAYAKVGRGCVRFCQQCLLTDFCSGTARRRDAEGAIPICRLPLLQQGRAAARISFAEGELANAVGAEMPVALAQFAPCNQK